jgi:pyruvate dehydrogenase E1 component alpha subunit
MATESVAEKAIAYGIPAVRVDGFDVVACWAATRAALERGRSAGGPTLIEAVTYRIGPHATADDPGRYRDAAVADKWRAKEPIGRLRRYLAATAAVGPGELDTIDADASERVATAVMDLDSSPRPSSDVLFETTYAGPMPPGLVADRDLLRSEQA